MIQSLLHTPWKELSGRVGKLVGLLHQPLRFFSLHPLSLWCDDGVDGDGGEDKPANLAINLSSADFK